MKTLNSSYTNGYMVAVKEQADPGNQKSPLVNRNWPIIEHLLNNRYVHRQGITVVKALNQCHGTGMDLGLLGACLVDQIGPRSRVAGESAWLSIADILC